jgi:DNA-binding NarL/FixJ family response regulator
VLRHLALGRSNREIAAALEIGDETVKTHVAKVLAKLGSRTARRRWCRRSRADWFRSMNQKPTSYGRVLLRAWRMIASM